MLIISDYSESGIRFSTSEVRKPWWEQGFSPPQPDTSWRALCLLYGSPSFGLELLDCSLQALFSLDLGHSSLCLGVSQACLPCRPDSPAFLSLISPLTLVLCASVVKLTNIAQVSFIKGAVRLKGFHIFFCRGSSLNSQQYKLVCSCCSGSGLSWVGIFFYSGTAALLNRTFILIMCWREQNLEPAVLLVWWLEAFCMDSLLPFYILDLVSSPLPKSVITRSGRTHNESRSPVGLCPDAERVGPIVFPKVLPIP